MTRRVLVTGAAGFLGSHVVERLLGEGDRVRALARAQNVPRWLEGSGAELVVGDVTDPALQALLTRDMDVVVHVASLVTEVAVTDAEYFRVNTEASASLARQAAASGVRRFVFVGSISVHRPNTGRPLDERSPLEPEDAYAASKAEAERRLATIAAETGMGVVVVRPSRIYGPAMLRSGACFARSRAGGSCWSETVRRRSISFMSATWSRPCCTPRGAATACTSSAVRSGYRSSASSARSRQRSAVAFPRFDCHCVRRCSRPR